MNPSPENKETLAFERGDIYKSEDSQLQIASINIVAGCLLLVGAVIGIERGFSAVQNIIRPEYSEGSLRLPAPEPATSTSADLLSKQSQNVLTQSWNSK